MRLVLLIFLLLLPVFSHAQLDTANLIGAQTSLVLFPAYPSPGQSFTVSLDDYSGGFYGAAISWFVNDTALTDFANNRSITLVAGEAGSTFRISAVLSLPNGGEQTISTSITPKYLDIIFEPQTHIPNFFNGRALPSQGSMVNATALIDGSSIATSDLIYTWQVGNEVINGGPLRGQNRISFTTPPGEEIIVMVQVTDGAGEVLARRTIAVPSVSPELHFYEVNTLYGVAQKSLSTLLLLGNSATLIAEPYYLDSRVFNQPDINVWEVDGIEYSPTGANPYEITLQRVNQGGSSELEFHVRSTVNFLQGVKSSLLISY